MAITGTGTSITLSPSGDITNVAAFSEASGEMNIEEVSSCRISQAGPEVITVYVDFQLKLLLSPHRFSPYVVLWSNHQKHQRQQNILRNAATTFLYCERIQSRKDPKKGNGLRSLLPRMLFILLPLPTSMKETAASMHETDYHQISGARISDILQCIK